MSTRYSRTSSKKALKATALRELVNYAMKTHAASQRIACQAVGLGRSVCRSQPDTERGDRVIATLQVAAELYLAYGFSKLLKASLRLGRPWSHKRIYRAQCLPNLNKRRPGKRRLPRRHPELLVVPTIAIQCWSIDLMSDSLSCGRCFGTFNVVDDFHREALVIEVELGQPAMQVVRKLEGIAAWHGYPKKLRMDNGPEFFSVTLADWAEEHGLTLEFIRPGKPMRNSCLERFNRTCRAEILNMYVF